NARANAERLGASRREHWKAVDDRRGEVERREHERNRAERDRAPEDVSLDDAEVLAADRGQWWNRHAEHGTREESADVRVVVDIARAVEENRERDVEHDDGHRVVAHRV